MDSSDESDSEILDNGDYMEADDLFGEDEEVGEGEEEKKKPRKSDDKDDKTGGESAKKPATRRVVQPRLILNLDRLKSEHGIPALMDTFAKFKFKGKNREKEDLTAIVNSLQHWMCHHLYPGYDAVTCMRILERLGKKRVVQTHIRRLRREAREGLLYKEEERVGDIEEAKIEDDGPSVDLSQFQDGFNDDFPDCGDTADAFEES